jgi:hypothetical protein
MNTSMAHQTDNKETMEAALPVIRFCFMMMMIMMMIDDDDEGFREAEMATLQSQLMAGFGRNCCRGHPSWVLGAGDDAMNGNAARARQAPFPWILSMQARKPRWQPRDNCWRRDGWLVAQALKWGNNVLVHLSESSTTLFVSQGSWVRK